MINFRFHLVSLTGVFLALAVGIILGASVVNSGAVDRLSGQLDSVKADVGRVDQQNQALRRDLTGWDTFSTKAAPGLLAGRLQGVPVLIVGVRGIDGDRVDQLRSDLVSADARVQGTVWITSKMQLDRQDDVNKLSEALNLGTTEAEAVRRGVLARLARELLAEAPASATTTTLVDVPNPSTVPGPTTTTARVAPRGGVLAVLSSGGFVEIKGPDTGPSFDAKQPLPAGTRFVVASGEGADVPDPQGAIALVRALAEGSGTSTRVLAVEPGRPAQGRDPEVRARFIGPLRAEGKELDNRISTVNNVEDFKGRVAAVLALVDLGAGRVGHYGVGSSAERPVPESG